MKESVLKKEFKPRDVARLRNLISGKTGDATQLQAGWEKHSVDHIEGDIWEESGKKWTIRNGIKQTVTKLDEIKKTQNDGLLTDIKTMKAVTDFYRQHFLGKVMTTTDTNLTQFLTNEQEPVVESLETLNEAGNVISTLVHKIESIPPFQSFI